MYGGYSNNIVVDERYVHTISPKLNLAAVGSAAVRRHHDLLAAAPLEGGQGQARSASSGLGGLGHMGLKFAHSFGAHVGAVHDVGGQDCGREEAGRRRGCRDQGCGCDGEASRELRLHSRLRLRAARHQPLPRPAAAERHAVPGGPARDSRSPVAPFSMVANRRSLCRVVIGGMKETQEMLDYCAEHDIVSDIELISVDKLAEAYERVVKSDVKYRFVIDMATLPKG